MSARAEDAAFVADAKRRWHALLDKVNDESNPLAKTAALSVALWASMNVDRLIDIAERKS